MAPPFPREGDRSIAWSQRETRETRMRCEGQPGAHRSSRPAGDPVGGGCPGASSREVPGQWLATIVTSLAAADPARSVPARCIRAAARPCPGPHTRHRDVDLVAGGHVRRAGRGLAVVRGAGRVDRHGLATGGGDGEGRAVDRGHGPGQGHRPAHPARPAGARREARARALPDRAGRCERAGGGGRRRRPADRERDPGRGDEAGAQEEQVRAAAAPAGGTRDGCDGHRGHGSRAGPAGPAGTGIIGSVIEGSPIRSAARRWG